MTLIRTICDIPQKLIIGTCFSIAFGTSAIATTDSNKMDAPTLLHSSARSACTNQEKWVYGDLIPEEWQKTHSRSLNGSIGSASSFAEALALRKQAKTRELKIFSEFWMSSALYKAGMIHVANNGFSAISAKKTHSDYQNIQKAALDCLSEINQKYPSIDIPQSALKNLSTLPSNTSQRRVAFVGALKELKKGTLGKDSNNLLKVIKENDPYGSFIRGVLAASEGKNKLAQKHLKRFTSKIYHDPLVSRQRDNALLILARSYFETGDYKSASRTFDNVSKSSNLLAQALVGQAWSDLVGEDQASAIGTSIQFNNGGLSSTFAPDAPVILSMALVELCQYPVALQSIDFFNQQYSPPYQWLKKWSEKKKHLYPEAIKFVEGSSEVPDKVATEWIRSPLFIARQDEINLIFKESKSKIQAEKKGHLTQTEMSKKLLKESKKLISQFNKYKADGYKNANLPQPFISDVSNLREDFIHFQRLRKAAPIWNRVVSSFDKTKVKRRNQLLDDINTDLRIITEKMMSSLVSTSENMQLVKMEVYNGATHDIVWQNANPDYEKVADEIEAKKKAAAKSKVWSWGQVSGGIFGNEEIWEDELGSFKAQLVNNCSTKKKFVQIKTKTSLVQTKPED